MHEYKVAVEPKGRMEITYHFHAYTAADALVQAKVFFDWQFDGGYTIHRLDAVGRLIGDLA
jgi:hypothetical protein